MDVRGTAVQQIDRPADKATSPAGVPRPIAPCARTHASGDARLTAASTSPALAQLARDAAAGNRSAHDALGDHCYENGRFGQAAEHYSEALIGELYHQHPQLAGPRVLLSMHLRQLIPPGSKARAVADHLARQRQAAERRARIAAALAGSIGGLVGWLGCAALTRLGLLPALPAELAVLLPALLALGCAAAARAAVCRRWHH